MSEQDTFDEMENLRRQASSPEANAALIREINGLGHSAVSLHKAFLNVELYLRGIINDKIPTDFKQDVQNLLTTWQSYRQTFSDLLWTSRDVAGKVQAAAEDFSVDFFPFLADDETPLSDKKQEISVYMEKLKKNEESSKEMSSGFSVLGDNISKFIQDWRMTVGKYDTNGLSSKIQDFNNSINSLEAEISGLNQKIADLSKSPSGFFSRIWGFICRVFSCIFGSESNDTVNARNRCLVDVARERAERDSAIAHLQGIQKLHAGLETCQTDFTEICSKLGQFSTVWAAVRRDIQAIEEKLDFASTSASRRLLQKRLQTTAVLYQALGKAMSHYQIAVSEDHEAYRNRNV